MGNGNGPFGFSLSLSLPTISRSTDKSLPRYAGGTDTFLIQGAEGPRFGPRANDATDDDDTSAAG
jgi:hypothetical protein